MKVLFRNSMVVAFLLALPSFGGSAIAYDSTEDYYLVHGSSPILYLDEDDSGQILRWALRNDYFIYPDSFLIQRFKESDDSLREPFIIESDTPTNLLYLDSSGNIGINTNVPSEELQINSTRPAIRLKDISSGADSVDLDMDGHIFSIWTYNSGEIVMVDTRAPFSSLLIDQNGYIGLGTSNPNANIHLAGGNDDATFLFETDGNGWYMLNKNASGRFNITDDPTFARVPFKIGVGAQQNLLKMGCGATDEVYISGNLIVAGTITPDYVFEDRYPLQSIEDHADVMWEKKHLPAVEKAKVDEEGKGVVNLGKRSQELLEELETAHIYIQQLNQEIKALKSLNSTMKESFEKKIQELQCMNNEKMKEIENRLARIES